MSKSDRNLANPIYAAVGAGDLALKQVNEVIAQLRERTETATEQAQARFEETRTTAQSRIEETRDRLTALPEEVPSTVEELRTKFTPEELRKVAEAYIEVATGIYNSLAERGEETVERMRTSPVMGEQISRAEKVYNDAVDLTEDTLGTISSQTRAVGQRAAKLAGRASTNLEEAIEDATDEATDKINGTAGKVEIKARASTNSPAKKLARAKAPAKKSPAQADTPATAAKATAKKAAPAKKAPAKKTAG